MSSNHAEQPASHWSAASRVLSKMSHPLVPSPEDIAFVERNVRVWSETHDPPRTLLMGVTPELYAAHCPAGTTLIAMDNNADMIANVWPGSPESALCCDWRQMCLDDGSIDIAICDGGLIMVPYPDDTRRVATELARVVRPGGLFVTRIYVPPRESESADAVLDDLLTGQVPSVNHLKLRLWAALQTDASRGIVMADVWDAVHHRVGDRVRTLESINWPADAFDTFDHYRDSAFRYYLPSLDQVLDAFTSTGSFEMADVETPRYPCGDRCPSIVLRRF